MSKKKILGTVLLLITAIIWGGSFVAQSSGGDAIGPFSFSCLRFTIATVSMLPVIALLDKKSGSAIIPKNSADKKLLIKAGVTCGVFLTGTSVFQQLGMYMGTSSGKAGFLTACYIVFVPIIGLFFNADFSDVVIQIGDVGIGVGAFLNAIINFLIVAFVLFVTIKAINMLHKKPVEEPKEPTTKKCPYCQSEIAIKAVRCPHCTSKLEGFPEAKL